MATKAGVTSSPYPRSLVVTWSGLANGDDGSPQGASWFEDRTVQVFGTFGTGGTVVIEGSLDGTNWETLTDQSGSALSFTAKGLRSVLQNTVYVRPKVTAGDGTTNLTVMMLMVE